MKWLVIIATILGLQTLPAQTNEPKTILVTNMVFVPGLRVIGGQVYNPMKSKLWCDVCSSIAPAGNPGYVNLEVETVGKKSVIFLAYVNDNGLPPSVGHSGSGAFIKRIIVFNHPDRNNLTSGQIIWGQPTFRAMKVENYHEGSWAIEAYDCGEPYTNKWPIVTIKRVKTMEEK